MDVSTGQVGKKLTLRYANLNGIKSNTEEVKSWISRSKADIGAFVETMADDSVADALIADLDLFDVHRKARTGCQKENGGGVTLICKKELQTISAAEYEVWSLVPSMRKVWSSFGTNLLVGVLYAPGYDLDVFTKLRTSLQLIPPRLRRNLVLLGDFNCPDYSIEETSVKTRRTRELVSVIKEFAIFQRVRGDTRQRKTSCSCLDLVFVSQLSLVRCVSIVPPPSIADSVDKYIVHPKAKADFIARVFLKEYRDCNDHCRNHRTDSRQPVATTSPRFQLPPVSTATVWSVLKNLPVKKAAGSSLITNALIRAAGTSLSFSLVRLLNLFLQTKQLPSSWKRADVVPIRKKGGATWKPISLLPPLSKIFEKIIAIQVSSFLERNSLFSDKQVQEIDGIAALCTWSTGGVKLFRQRKKWMQFSLTVPKLSTGFLTKC
ncbi:hypothetical protein RvY_04365-1 [Ramazzottius varieornatus]|uniref:Endonuclease/exonuclease/phosphatase domain-containing protein n=1 Tax=Ramazzottius varieornatus TaxID=947166 RepID=A0A1D1V0N1_RAMVA|nr:hypothetical protein RvY_04365-1 [Ramazzottius varieornatus]